MKPTREGKRFLLAALLIAVAAVNTGNNLIYLIFGMMLGILAVSVLLLIINLKGLAVILSATQPVFANNSSNISISINNRKKLIPSYSIRIIFPKNIEGDCLMPFIPAASSSIENSYVVFKKRGLYSHSDFFIESGFPFILFKKRIKPDIVGDIIVYPEIKHIDESLSAGIGSNFNSHLTKHGYGDEFMSIREFRYGDAIRRVHWKSTAKTGKLMIKEMGQPEAKLVTIIIDNIKPSNKEFFEKAVSFAASFAYKYINSGFLVRLATCKKILPFGNGSEQLFKILDLLAMIEEEDTWDCPMIYEMQGSGILILKSDSSSLKKMESISNMVIYASDL
ncbi:MAG: DUF58 domain-containing protein [Nitrospiraceae bacterium]|nr:DUF58 domain-containing protein [Nitrospiraceae bacterium]